MGDAVNFTNPLSDSASTKEIARWLKSFADTVAQASSRNLIQDVHPSGAALSTLNNAVAGQVPFFTGPTTVSLTSLADLQPGGATGTVQYNNGGVFGGMTGSSWNDTTRSLSLSSTSSACSFALSSSGSGNSASFSASSNAGDAFVNLNENSSGQAHVDFRNNNNLKWQVGKDSSHNFFGFDGALSKNWLTVQSINPLNFVNFLNSNVVIFSGATTAVVPFELHDNVPGQSITGLVVNDSTSNNSEARLQVTTGVANAFAFLSMHNQVANPTVLLAWGPGVTAGHQLSNNGTIIATWINGLQVGAPTGGDKGAGTINVATNVFKNNTAYTNPDYVLEHYATGKIEKYKHNEGASDYTGRLSLDDLERFIRTNYRLPRIADGPTGIFTMADIALEKIEELTLYVIDLHKRIRKLENRLAVYEAEASNRKI